MQSFTDTHYDFEDANQKANQFAEKDQAATRFLIGELNGEQIFIEFEVHYTEDELNNEAFASCIGLDASDYKSVVASDTEGNGAEWLHEDLNEEFIEAVRDHLDLEATAFLDKIGIDYKVVSFSNETGTSISYYYHFDVDAFNEKIADYLVIDEDALEEVVLEAANAAHDFSWSGWGIDVVVDDKIGVLKPYASDFNNEKSYTPGTIELTRIERWSVDELDDENPDREESISHHAGDLADRKIEWLKECIQQGKFTKKLLFV